MSRLLWVFATGAPTLRPTRRALATRPSGARNDGQPDRDGRAAQGGGSLPARSRPAGGGRGARTPVHPRPAAQRAHT
eukprot:1796782-Prymnesium_polylepis.1